MLKQYHEDETEEFVFSLMFYHTVKVSPVAHNVPFLDVESVHSNVKEDKDLS